MRVAGMVTVMEVEARGVQEAINWVEEMGLQGITIECDSELVMRTIHSAVEYYPEVRHIVEFCMLQLKHRPDLFLHHIKKQANHVAHCMARALCVVDCYNVFESPSDMLLKTLCSEYTS